MTSTSGPGILTRLGSLTVVLFVLVGLNAADMLLVAFGNITDFPTNQAFVQHVLSMDTTNFGEKQGTDLDATVMYRAITDPVLQNIAYIGIIAAELAAGLILAGALIAWLVRRTDDALARTLASIGLLLIIVIFMGGFVVVGGEWFQMWRSTAWNGEDAALRTVLLAAVPLILLHLPRRATA